jgi:hypothetical protein
MQPCGHKQTPLEDMALALAVRRSCSKVKQRPDLSYVLKTDAPGVAETQAYSAEHGDNTASALSRSPHQSNGLSGQAEKLAMVDASRAKLSSAFPIRTDHDGR